MLRVEIKEDDQPEGESKLKIFWTISGYERKPYSVPRTRLNDAGKEVREALQALIEKGMKNGGRLGRCGAELKELAAKGQALYEELFYISKDSDPNTIQDIQNLLTNELASLRARGEKAQMIVKIKTPVYIPWGLIYDGPVEELSGDPEQDSIEYYEDFWCLKLSLSSVYYLARADNVDATDASAHPEILSVFNRGVLDKAEPHLLQPQDRILAWLQAAFSRQAESSAEFFRTWQDIGKQCRMLYFYCHADAEALELSLDDRISVSNFRRKTTLKGGPWESTCLVFLNGCVTAAGKAEGRLDEGFLVATCESVFCGFVGTETMIPDVFALRFGLAFLYYFLHEGWPVYQVMDYLRRHHWPIALAYSAYCPWNLSFGAAEKSLDIELSDNYSLMPLGTSVMCC